MAVQRGQIGHEESDWPQLKGWSCSDILPSSTYLSVSVYVHVGEGACLEVKDNLGKAVYLLRDRPFLDPESTNSARLADWQTLGMFLSPPPQSCDYKHMPPYLQLYHES